MTDIDKLWPEFDFRVVCDECDEEIARGSRDELAIGGSSYFKKLISSITSRHEDETGHVNMTVDIAVTTTDVLKTIDTTVTIHGDSDD